MPKQRSHKVNLAKKNPNFVGTIKMSGLRKKVRKPLPPPTQRFASKIGYKRKPKHPTESEES